MPCGRHSSTRRCENSASDDRRPVLSGARLSAGALAALVFAWTGAQAASFREETIALQLDDGRTLTAQLRLPHGDGRFPAIMLFGGFRNAATVLDRVRSERPLVWATFDYPFEAPRKFRFPQSLQLAPDIRAAIHGTFDGVGKLYAALRTHPRVDAARITVVGASAGAPFATVGAAQHGIPGVVLVQGFGKATLVVQNLLARKYEPKWGAWVRGPAWLLAAWITWYCEVPKIEDYAAQLRAPQKVLAIAARDDEFIPAASSEALWAGLERSSAQRERVVLDGGHLGVGDDTQLIAEILQQALGWMGSNGLL